MGTERKIHRKTRTGCVTCKRRRIKCDENKPKCNNCTNRRLDCAYETVAIASPITPGASTSTSDYDVRSPGGFGAASPHFTLDDLKLIHHWSTQTYRTFFEHEFQKYVWRDDVPKLAFQHDFLLQGVLCLSLVHQAYLQKKKSGSDSFDEATLRTAAQYQNRSLATGFHAVQNITPENAGALLVFNTCIFVSTLALARHERTFDKMFEQGTTEKFPNWLRLTRGIKLLSDSWPWVLQSPVAALLPQKDFNAEFKAVTPKETEFLERLRRMKPLWQPDSTDQPTSTAAPTKSYTPEQIASLDKGLADLGLAYLRTSHLYRRIAATPHGEPIEFTYSSLAAILTWQHQIDEHLVAMIERQDTAALVQLAHYAMLLSAIEVWYTEGVPQDMIIAIARCLGDQQKWIEWPMQELGVLPVQSIPIANLLS